MKPRMQAHPTNPTQCAPAEPPRITAAVARVLAALIAGATLYSRWAHETGVLVREGESPVTVPTAIMEALRDGGYVEQGALLRRHSDYHALYRPTLRGTMAWTRYDLDHLAAPANAPAYAALVAEATRLGWPAHYATDLTVHDRSTLLRAGAPTTFGWRLSEWGTTLYRAEEPADLTYAANSIANALPEDRYYWWSDNDSAVALEEVTTAELLRRLQRHLEERRAEEDEARS